MAAPTDAQLSQSVVYAFVVVFLDVMDGVTPDPIRAALSPFNLSIPAGMSGDADIDGQTFSAVDPTTVEIGAPTFTEGGSETLTMTLSATIAGDADILNQLGNPANFRGRPAKIFIGLHDEVGTVIACRSAYIGYMQVPEITSSQNGQTLTLLVENYLSLYSGGPPARTLLSQKLYDPGDHSADATTGAANGQSVIAPGFLIGGARRERGDRIDLF